jgi:flagellar biosynthesis protein FlhB
MSDAADRTIPATPRRREMARRQGVMPMAGLPAWVATVATTLLLLPAWAQATFSAATDMMQQSVCFTAAGRGAQPLLDLEVPAAVVLPTLALVAVAGAVGLSVRVLLDGPAWRPARLVPSFDRISLLAGLARICSAPTKSSPNPHSCRPLRSGQSSRWWPPPWWSRLARGHSQGCGSSRRSA